MRKISELFILLILFFLTATLQGCWLEDDDNINATCESDCTIIEGKFTTDDGNTPIANVTLKFEWGVQPTPGGFAGVKTRKIATTTTDKDGKYRIGFYAEDEELAEGSFAIHFFVSDNLYLTREDNSYIEFSGINRRDTLVTRNYHIPRKGASINVKIKNPADIASDDKLYCDVYYKYDDLTKHIGFSAGQLFSQFSSEATFGTAANQYTYIQIVKHINGEEFDILDSIFIFSDETKIYEISY